MGVIRTVRLRAYGGEIIERVLLAVERGTVVVCRKEEYEAAERERREPVVIGFPLSDVVESDEGAE